MAVTNVRTLSWEQRGRYYGTSVGLGLGGFIPQAGDLLILAYTSSNNLLAPYNPANWTQVYSIVGGAGASTRSTQVWWKWATGTEQNIYIEAQSSGTRTYDATYVLLVYRNVDPNDPVPNVAARQAWESDPLPVDHDGLVVGLWGRQVEGTVVDPLPSALTYRYQTADGRSPIVAADRPVTEGQTVPSYTLIRTSGTGSVFAVVLALRAANLAPHAPTLLSPADGAVIARTQAQTFRWAFNDPDPLDTQSAYRLRYRPQGTTTWAVDTGWVTSTSTHHTMPAGELTTGGWEWQVATRDSRGLAGSFSPSGYFTADTPPPGPSILSPANGATIPTAGTTLSWSTPDQDAYQVQVRDGDTVLWDTGQVSDSATVRSRLVELPDNQTIRTLAVRVLHHGLWSPWGTVTVTVDYTPPATPVLTVTSVSTLAGAPHGETDALHVHITHPAPVGNQPAVEAVDIHVREVGALGPGVRVAANVSAAMWRWWVPPSGVDIEVRALARGATGATAWTPWTT